MAYFLRVVWWHQTVGTRSWITEYSHLFCCRWCVLDYRNHIFRLIRKSKLKPV
jgi:hypothetical protein